MNRFSQEVPPKTAWTVVAGLVVVFIMVFSLASNSEGDQTGMLGAVVKGTTAVSKVVTTIVTAPIDVVKSVFVAENTGSSFANVKSQRSFEECVISEIALMRTTGVVAVNSHDSVRGDSSKEVQAKNASRASIRSAMQSVGVTPGTDLGCVVTGVTSATGMSSVQISALTNQGFVVSNFGNTVPAVSGQSAEEVVVPAGN